MKVQVSVKVPPSLFGIPDESMAFALSKSSNVLIVDFACLARSVHKRFENFLLWPPKQHSQLFDHSPSLHERRRARETHSLLLKSMLLPWKVLARKSSRAGRAFCATQVRRLEGQGK